MTKSITLFMENDKGEEVEKTFYQPSRIKGKAARVGLKLGEKLEKAQGGIPEDSLIDEMLQYIAEYGYNEQFTADQLEDGLDARDLFQSLAAEVRAIINRTDDTAEGKSTKTKQNSSQKISPTKANEKA